MDLQNARAVLATGLLAAHADGLHAASERAALRAALERMDARLDLGALENEIVAGRRDLKRTASELTTHEARELAYELAVSVCDADGEANAEERTFLDALERALGISPESGATLRRDAGALATAPLAGTGEAAGTETDDVDALILAQAMLCGGLELLPQRLATLAILPLQLRLVYRIGKRHGYELDRDHTKEFLAVLGVGLASQVIESCPAPRRRSPRRRRAGRPRRARRGHGRRRALLRHDLRARARGRALLLRRPHALHAGPARPLRLARRARPRTRAAPCRRDALPGARARPEGADAAGVVAAPGAYLAPVFDGFFLMFFALGRLLPKLPLLILPRLVFLSPLPMGVLVLSCGAGSRESKGRHSGADSAGRPPRAIRFLLGSRAVGGATSAMSPTPRSPVRASSPGVHVPLRVHGWHSLLTGVDAPATLLARAAELGLPALALTDVDTLSGSVDFLQAARRLGGPRPILGAELSDPGGRPGRVVALARDAQGYRNLCKLVSARQLGDDPGEAAAHDGLAPLRGGGAERFDLAEAAARFQEGLTLLVDHPRLVLALEGRVPAERLLVAVSPAALALRGDTTGGRKGRRARPRDVEEPWPTLPAPKVPPPARPVPARVLVECARLAGLATVAMPDVYWALPTGLETHRVRVAIKHNALRCDLPDAWLARAPAHLQPTAELEALYAALPECRGPFGPAPRGRCGALARTLAVADACAYVPPLGGVVFPSIDLGEHETAYSRLCALAFDGARKRYVPLRPEVVRRLDHELEAIEGLGFAPYFLLVKRIADFARGRGIPCVGRGSAADSLVAYCLELTDADPLRYRLPFERFLNPARKDRPDIDLDFCWRRRDEVLAELGATFGVERTAMIATLNTFGLRAAFRATALAEGLPPVEVNRWSRRLPGMGSMLGAAEAGGGEVPDGAADDDDEDGEARAPELADEDAALLHPLPDELAGEPVARTFAATPECRGFPFDDPRWRFVLRQAGSLLDCPSHLGLHPGGVVVTPGPITDFVSCQRAAKGVITTQLDKDGVEAVGLVKMDLLGNRALTVIDDCLRALGKDHAELERIAEDDERTGTLLESGRTLGCFQVESPAMRNLLKQIAARRMDDVIQAVALIRPGPAGSGMKDAYVRRFRGLEEPRPPHPRLGELLWETHGVMLYQEDVMQAVVLMAGFELSEADLLRRALGKKRGAELDELRERFLAACERERISASDAEHVWELIGNFASFGFCKAHAVTYGRIAYRAVWLKAHHPAEFMTAFLNSATGYYETRVYVEEARRMGVAILPPDVNRSADGFTLERGPEGRAGIRVGLERVKGLSEGTRRSLADARSRGGPFLSLPDLLERSGARVDELERLILCGALDAFDRTRPEMLWRLRLLTAPARKAPPGLDAGLLAACRTSPGARERDSGWSRTPLALDASRLAPGESTPLFPAPLRPSLALPALPELDPVRRGRLELELLGLTVGAHPTALFPRADADEHEAPLPCAELERHRDRRVVLVGWLAAARPVRTSEGRWMRFLTLEDESGIAEVVLFPDVYARDGHRLSGRGPFRVAGVVQDDMGSCTLKVERVF